MRKRQTRVRDREGDIKIDRERESGRERKREREGGEHFLENKEV